MKKLLCLLMAGALMLSAMSTSTFAAGDYAGKTVVLFTANLRGDVTVYPQMAALRADYQAKGADVVLVDAGNFLQGSAAANTDRGLSVYRLMDAAGYDAAAMGLAEFSYGDASTGMPYHGNVTRYHTQKQLQEGCPESEYNVNRDGSVKASLATKEPASFHALASNVTANEDFYSFERSAVIKTKSGLTLGLYGVTDPGIAEHLQDGLVTAIQPAPAAPDLSCDLTVCLTNAPGLGREAADLVIDGSSGEKQAGAYVIDNATRAISAEAIALSAADPTVKTLADAAAAAAGKAVGKSQVILSGKDSIGWRAETNLGDLTTDALRWYAENYIDGIDRTLPLVAIQNGGNCDQFLYPGDITETDLLRALPFSPMGVGVIQLTGAQLLEVLESAASPSQRYGEELCPGFAQVSGLHYTLNRNEAYDGGEAYGSFYRADSITRITIDKVGDGDFDPEKLYAVVADNYLINGNDTYYVLKEAKEAGAPYINNGNGVKTRDMVAMYIQSVLNGTVGDAYAAPQGRIRVIEKSPFADVPQGAYYYDAVQWAVHGQVAMGAPDGTFSPEQVCTRAQFVTLLWRAAGAPRGEGQGEAFADVPQGAYYAQAVEWAAEKGITGGVGEGRFDPEGTVSRAQAVAFLFRYHGGEAPGGENPFVDVPEGAYYQDAVRWAVEAGITTGVSSASFAPDGPCTRGQAVTFLFRLLAE